MESIPEDEETGILQSRGFAGVMNGILPAAGRPASVPPPRSTLRPPPMSVRGNMQNHLKNLHEDDDDDDDDDNDGRTAVRGAPRIKRIAKTNAQQMQPQTIPNAISPAAVIKATMESARANANRRDVLTADMPDEFKDRSSARRSPAIFNRHPAAFEGPPSLRPPQMAANEGPPSYPPASNYAPPSSGQLGGNAGYSGGYAPMQGGAIPAHFRTPQAPSSDPPGTAVSSDFRSPGRPAMSWAAALLACGLFVGVAAVAVMQSSDGVADTTASFVDPARAPLRNAGGPAMPVPVDQPTLTAPAAGGVIGASNVVAPTPVVPTPVTPTPVVAVVPAEKPAGTTFAPVAVPKKPVFAWRPAAARAAAAPKAEKAERAEKAEKADADEPKEAKASKSQSSKKKGGEADDETKKALDALQKAQLESASSFGEK